MLRILLVSLFAFTLVACADKSQDGDTHSDNNNHEQSDGHGDPQSDSNGSKGVAQNCRAPKMQGLVGRSSEFLARMKFSEPMRVIRPRTAVTQDYRPERISFYVDENEIITKVSCG